MTVREIAQMIPQEYRKEIIETGLIHSAIPTITNPSMNYLGIIWKNYVSPEEDLHCGLCLQRIIENYRQMEPILIQLEKERKLLNSV